MYELIALRRRAYDGRRLEIGERFQARSARDAKTLVKIGLAREATAAGPGGAKPPAGAPGRPKPEHPIAEPKPDRDRPERRPHPEQPIAEPRPDLPAEPVTPEPLPAEPEPEREPKKALGTATLRGRSKPS